VGAGTGIASVLRPGGRLPIIANRIHPTRPTQQELDEINADYLDVTPKGTADAEAQVIALIEAHGFAVARRDCVEELHYSTDEFVDLLFTYSNHLVLDPPVRDELRARLMQRIGAAGVDARNDASAFVCTPTR
jgi:hypothetical protein